MSEDLKAGDWVRRTIHARFTPTDRLAIYPKPITPAQQRTYDAIKAAGEKVYNGRKGKVLRNLRALGLVEFDYYLVPNGRDGLTERYTARVCAKPAVRMPARSRSA
jgi:hypothetical protein